MYRRDWSELTWQVNISSEKDSVKINKTSVKRKIYISRESDGSDHSFRVLFYLCELCYL